jgi:hypothetical protein
MERKMLMLVNITKMPVIPYCNSNKNPFKGEIKNMLRVDSSQAQPKLCKRMRLGGSWFQASPGKKSL